MKRSRVLLANDHVLILEGLRTILEPCQEVVGAVSDGRSLVDAALRLKPDLIVLDVTLPLLSGTDAARQIRKSLPRVKLLFLTVHANPAYLREALNAGATGYILESSTREEILGAVTKALAGQTYVSFGAHQKCSTSARIELPLLETVSGTTRVEGLRSSRGAASVFVVGGIEEG